MDTNTDFDLVAYAAMAERLIKDFSANPRNYPTAHSVVKSLYSSEECAEINLKVLHEADAHLKIKPTQFEAAMRKLEATKKRENKEQEKAEYAARRKAEAEARQADKEAHTGGPVRDARSFIHGLMTTNGIEVRYDRDCVANGKKLLASDVMTDALLTAEAARYTFGEDKIMTTAGVKLALEEYMEQQRAMRRQAVLESITRPPDDPHVIQKFRDRICQHVFSDPELGCRGFLKVIWQAKRRLLGLYVELLQMLVLYGPQGSGKSELIRNFYESTIGELAAECDMGEVCDDRNFQLRSNLLLFVDEVAGADRADLNKLKNIITAAYHTARVLYSHGSQKLPLALTLVGTVDRRLNTIIRDVAGMRRFVEIDVLPRAQQAGLHWQDDVVSFPWLDLWRAVDHTAADPLMSVLGDQVRAHQEDMRTRTNTEAWLEQFEEPKTWPQLTVKQTTETTIEFLSDKLYRDVFRKYEENFHPGSTPTSHITWGRAMRTLIEQQVTRDWEWRVIGHNVVYTYLRKPPSNVTPMYGNGRDLVPVPPSPSNPKQRRGSAGA